jgi:type IV pilus biogenesis protein PilP
MFPAVRNIAFLLVAASAASWANPPADAPAPAPAPFAPQAVRTGAPVAPTAPTSAANPTPVRVDPASAGLTKDSIDLGELKRQTANANEKLKLLTAQAQVTEAQKRNGQTTQATADIPELIGIEGAKGHMRAQFLVGSSISTVAVGQMLTSDWKIEQIMSNGVSMSRRGNGRDVHTILFGHAPVRGGATLLTNDAPGQYAGQMPAMPPMQPMPVVQSVPIVQSVQPSTFSH